MINKEFNDITVADFQALVDNGVAEGKTIEYKKDIKISTDGEKKEFLFDVSSFANASGGDLVIGISENRASGLPESVEGFSIENSDEFIRKIENLIRDGIQPRIAGIRFQAFQLSNSNSILLLRIPKSWQSPHQVIFQGADKFYTRATNGKYKLDVNELRNAFILSDTITERVRKFREDRINKIISDETPAPLFPYAKVVLQLIPLSSFEPKKVYDISRANLPANFLRPLTGNGGWNEKYNLDGLSTHTNARNGGQVVAYVQLFRNGIIETVSSELLEPYDNKKMIPSVSGLDYEKELIESFKGYMVLIEKLKIDFPIYVYLTFLGVKGYYLESSRVRSLFGAAKIDRDILLLPEIIIENTSISAEATLKPLFDMIWNACGYERSMNYDAAGNYIGVK